jgi:hypothetical protein
MALLVSLWVVLASHSSVLPKVSLILQWLVFDVAGATSSTLAMKWGRFSRGLQ